MDKVEGVFITKEQLKEIRQEAFEFLIELIPDSSTVGMLLCCQTSLALDVFEAYINNDKDFIEKVINDYNESIVMVKKELNKDE